MAAATRLVGGSLFVVNLHGRKRVSPRNPFSVRYSTDLESGAAKILSKADNNR
jgi:hypothetical protein